mgnify:CR=1 FL=1
MTKADLVEKIAAKANLTKAAAERALNAFLASVEESLAKDDKLTLTGFGTFVVETRKERQGRNPRTGETLTIPACKMVKFRPGKMLKDALDFDLFSAASSWSPGPPSPGPGHAGKRITPNGQEILFRCPG